QQVSGMIRGIDLQKYITESEIPEKFLTDDDRVAGNVKILFIKNERNTTL
ncbi:hypothetical protein A2U01_0104299, partial [Trifolium medium]|nr:hypothetical protein [Trifolium medium]